MDKTKDFTKESIVNDVNEARKALGLSELTKAQIQRTTGQNGIAVGQTVKFTGNVNLAVPVEVNDKITGSFIGVELDNGLHISLNRLMGISSMQGYATEGTFENVHREGSKIVTNEVKAEVIEDFSFDDVFQPSSRNLFEFAAHVKSTNFFAGKQATLIGKVVREFPAKNDSPAGSFESYKKGDKRAMTATLWRVY